MYCKRMVAMSLSITAFSITTVRITFSMTMKKCDIQHNCKQLFMLSAIVMSIANKPAMPSNIMLSVVMLNVIMLSVMEPKAVCSNFHFLLVFFNNVIK